MFFDGWDSILRIVLLMAAAYLALVAALRVAGEQALAKMSAYDMVVTVALGSVLVAIPFTSGVTLADGLAGIMTLLGLQAFTRWAVQRSRAARTIVLQRPNLVLWAGELLPDRLEEVSVRPEEVLAAVRSAHLGSLQEAQAVVLEADGGWSVVPRAEAGDLTALQDLDLPRRR